MAYRRIPATHVCTKTGSLLRINHWGKRPVVLPKNRRNRVIVVDQRSAQRPGWGPIVTNPLVGKDYSPEDGRLSPRTSAMNFAITIVTLSVPPAELAMATNC